MKTAKKIVDRSARKRRIRARITGSAARPRLAVFKSLSAIYAQVIDDSAGKTLVAANDLKIKKGNKTERATEVGKMIAEAAQKVKIEKVVFDRGGFPYTGRIKALAEAAREAGLKF
ncbi:MAG: 50S ribosomal protein L18 [Patescibacteria group bacterium]